MKLTLQTLTRMMNQHLINMHNVINKLTGDVYVADTLWHPVADIATMTIQIQKRESKKTRKVKAPKHLFDGTIKNGEFINIVTFSGRIISGYFGGIWDDCEAKSGYHVIIENLTHEYKIAYDTADVVGYIRKCRVLNLMLYNDEP